MTLSIVSKCFALLRSDPHGRLCLAWSQVVDHPRWCYNICVFGDSQQWIWCLIGELICVLLCRVVFAGDAWFEMKLYYCILYCTCAIFVKESMNMCFDEQSTFAFLCGSMLPEFHLGLVSSWGIALLCTLLPYRAAWRRRRWLCATHPKWWRGNSTKQNFFLIGSFTSTWNLSKTYSEKKPDDLRKWVETFSSFLETNLFGCVCKNLLW